MLPAPRTSDAVTPEGGRPPSPQDIQDISETFARALDAARPFEPRAHLAVAVSGGADSMALLLLADRWARAQRGRVTALTVDHGLRAEAGAEARQVGRWCRARGIAHRTLIWRPPEGLPKGDVQAAARAGRYRLMAAWCRSHAVLHLLTAHNQGDQAETFLMRLGRQSGLNGLAAMALVRETDSVRLIRPLLACSRAGIEACLKARGQDWIEDPSNRDRAFARVRLRGLVTALEAEGLGAGAQAHLAARFGRLRSDLEARVAGVLARAARPHPAGFVMLDRAALGAAGHELGKHALARVLAAVAGSAYPVRGDSLARLYDGLSAGLRGRTLGGCRILARGPDTALVCREAGAIAPPVTVQQAGTIRWDGRYLVTIRTRTAGVRCANVKNRVVLGALGEDGWAALCRACPGLRESAAARAVPAPARVTLPALRDKRGGLLQVPYFGYRRSVGGAGTLFAADARPDVPEPLAGPRFGAAPGNL